jgi:ketosteroid isomerase-like protein
MSRENAELFYKWNSAFNRRDLDALLALADPDIELLSRIAEVEGGGPYRGHDGVRSWWESLFSISPDYSAELEEVRDLGKVTLARVHNRGHGLGSDAPMGETSWDVIEWRRKKAIWWGSYRSEDDALEAAGLRDG